MKEKELYHVAVYLRLSRDDEDIGRKGSRTDGGCEGEKSKTESNSIGSQRELIHSFISQSPGMEIYDHYVDDGFSGANFDRPQFKRMMEDVKAGRVDCIIVKDLSRFGRDYIEAGRLIQKTFPALNVRFIAITDRFDSLTADFNETALVLPVKNFVNDSYCRDISGKVKSHQKVKRENGEFIGAFAVYGYRKDEKERNRLTPDPYAAQIVRKIYGWRIEGMSALAIAQRLNEAGVLPPLEYKKSRGENYTTGFRTGVKTQWSAVAVKRILVNEVYTGALVQGKREKVNYKLDKYVDKPREEWVRVEHAHEAVVTREEFENVQRLLAVDCRAGNGQKKAHLFSGLLFCGDCREPMIRRVNRYHGTEKVTFICPTRNRGEGCSRHSVAEEELKEAVLRMLRTQLSLLADRTRTHEAAARQEVDLGELSQFEREIARLRKELERYDSLRRGLYEDYKAGILTKEDYQTFSGIYEERYERVKDAAGRQEGLLQAMFRSGVASGVRLERFKEEAELPALNRPVLLTFVDRILVYEDKRICLRLRCREPFEGAVRTGEDAIGERGPEEPDGENF